jgi:hypothetical protein
MVALDESVGSGLTASERQPVFIVDSERFDLITTLSRCRENFAAACDLWQTTGGKTGSFADSEGD